MRKEDGAKDNAGTQNVCHKLVGSTCDRLQFGDGAPQELKQKEKQEDSFFSLDAKW